ncbi:hypothetical protein HSX37_10845|uniref:Uncharacterized protein n=1 Tax=Dendrosporobacter quercicolus TaxID=146817 RepID=A0A1G9T7C1_9FIRM|nr:hypothetical protein [Dendrosporobacter quercicolus]NSL48528.1 hypothetical protein [Dendrosporobacter quercicolus DSM 1736]SDM43581.1 hypothetical protein SAMN04488502_104237 [Dendrosporobacter quercicolus]
MDKKSATSKLIRRKYKRYAAAVAGAAIMAGAGLPAVVSAADNTTGMTYHNDQQSVKKVATKSSKDTKSNKSTNRSGGWHQHRTSWPSSSENRGWVDGNGRIYYSSDNYRNGAHYDTRYDGRSRGYYNGGYYYRDNDNTWRYSGNYRTGSTTVSPVEFAKTNASQYGLDRNKDSFSLVSQTGSSASVLIKKSTTGKQYIMNLERDNYRSWKIVAVRSITS